MHLVKGLRGLSILSLLPVLISCYVHRGFDPRGQVAPVPDRKEVRVLTLRGEVFMLRSVAVHGDTVSGERIFCKSGWGYDEGWCKGVQRFPADSSRLKIPVGDIREAHTRSLSRVRTASMAAAITAGLSVGILAAIASSHVVPLS